MKITFTITIDVTKVATGHRQHKSGAGKHGDRRNKRERNRSQQKLRIFREQE